MLITGNMSFHNSANPNQHSTAIKVPTVSKKSFVHTKSGPPNVSKIYVCRWL